MSCCCFYPSSELQWTESCSFDSGQCCTSVCTSVLTFLRLAAAPAFSSHSAGMKGVLLPAQSMKSQFPLESHFKWMKPVLLFIPPSWCCNWLFEHPVSFRGLNQVCFFSSIASVASFSWYEILSQKIHSWNRDVWDFPHDCCGEKGSFTFLAQAIVLYF